ncbi:hypothetical protein [Hymenobacter weizhouensis]|uniref:hypothetical protein n=1 Tax=Hymenobacter sp. YIM 151500-1 TaxID=2987689 RepID=UPI0022265F8F|nr:hypothetical protein [Hymenobacter sp. YIM 151500-1]UYZ64120.1 hypothetical protein OIS53_04550 [Hymenobacter sp. YIM 151500-1]
MPLFDIEIIKKEVKTLPQIAGYSGLMVAVLLLTRYVERGGGSLINLIPGFLSATAKFTALFFTLGCALSLGRAALKRKNQE